MHQHNIVKSWRRVSLLSAAFLLALSIGTGCKKESGTIGSGALNPDDLLASGAVDTFHIVTSSEVDDSVRTDNQRSGLVGAYNDPKMGTMVASLYTQVSIAGTLSLAPDVVVQIDSMVLALEYGGYYGKLTPQTFEVYRLAEDLSLTTTYYQFDTKAHLGGNITDPSPGWSSTITPNPTAEVTVGEDTLEAQLRLRLDTNVARSMISDLQAGNSGFANNANFQSYFKGLHIKVTNESPAPSTGGIMYFRMTDNNTKMTIYYHIAGDQLARTIDFAITGGTCADFNNVTVTNPPEVQNVIDNPETNSMQQFYAQAFKSRGRVRFAGIDNLPKKCIIHDALLVLPVSYQAGTQYYPSVAALLGYKKSTANALTAFGSVSYDAPSTSYIIDVKSYVQSIVVGDAENTGLYIYPFYMGGSAERIIFNGPNTTNKKKPRLLIKYTEY